MKCLPSTIVLQRLAASYITSIGISINGNIHEVLKGE